MTKYRPYAGMRLRGEAIKEKAKAVCRQSGHTYPIVHPEPRRYEQDPDRCLRCGEKKSK